MINPHITVLVLGIARSMPTFIKRRLLAFDSMGLRLILPVYNHQEIKDFKNAHVVRLTDIHKANIVYVCWALLLFIVKFPANIKTWRTFKGQSFYKRLESCLTAIKLTGFSTVDIIHLQWLVPEERYKFLSIFYPNVPILLSVRGSQVTVYPKTNSGKKNLVKMNFQMADAIHCVSKDLARQCKELGALDEKLFVNYNGIDTKRFKPEERKWRYDVIKIVSVGALIWRKGYVFQLQIISELLNRGVKATLHIVGSGDELNGLKYIAYRLGVNHAVFFEGQRSEDFIRQFLPTMDIFLSTSAAEGLPNSLVEAAACGLPIVTFDCEGAKEIVDEGKTGYVIPYGEIHRATDKIILLSKGSNLQQAGRTAREKVLKEFDEQPWLAKMIDRYDLIRKKGK